MYIANDFPVSCKDSFVIFISKPDGVGLKPISLTSCFCKLLETLVKNRLQWWVETNGFLPSNQHGFRKGRSCIDNLTGLALKVNEAFLEKKVVIAAFLDVQGAFDNVNIDIVAARYIPA
ncbi:Probable RNA-directed DNA polymerase from transposon X-element [Anthophora plagiata]